MIVIVVLIAVLGRFLGRAFGGFTFSDFAFGGLALAQSLVVFLGIEQEMQPRHHLFDRR